MKRRFVATALPVGLFAIASSSYAELAPRLPKKLQFANSLPPAIGARLSRTCRTVFSGAALTSDR
jgi:hypothetical protein